MSKDFFDKDDLHKHKKESCETCDPCKHDKYDHKEKERGLLTELEVDQAPYPVPFTGVPSLGNQFTELDVCTDDCDYRVVLDLTVEWLPTPLTVTAAILALLTTGITVGVPAQFRIWRRSSEGTVLISEKTDTSPIFALAIPPVAGSLINFANTTTTIHAVDPDPTVGKNEYFATIEFDTSVVPATILTGLLGAGVVLSLTPANIVSYTFTAEEIEANA